MTSSQRLSRLILCFSIFYVLLVLCPDLLTRDVIFFPLLKNEDLATLLTPFVIIPLYAMMYEVKAGLAFTKREVVFFLLVAIAWANGHGMHVASNAIGRLLQQETTTQAYRLTYFIDEIFSHYLWALAGQLMTLLILVRQWKHPFEKARSTFKLEAFAAVLYGSAHFLTSIEGQTTPIGIPFALLITAFAAWKGFAHLRTRPLLAFYVFSYGFSLLLFLAWGVYWKGLPELSAVGLI